MSSPAKRRTQKSQSATPRRGTRSSQALPSSPPDPSVAQLMSEAASSSQTPRSGRHGVPKSSSPIAYQSSPAPSARSAATPMNDVAMTDDDRTPRPSGLGHMMGGRYNCITETSISNINRIFASPLCLFHPSGYSSTKCAPTIRRRLRE